MATRAHEPMALVPRELLHQLLMLVLIIQGALESDWEAESDEELDPMGWLLIYEDLSRVEAALRGQLGLAGDGPETVA